MSRRKASEAVQKELSALFEEYIKVYPEDRPLTKDKYLAFLKEHGSDEAYDYAVRCENSHETIQ